MELEELGSRLPVEYHTSAQTAAKDRRNCAHVASKRHHHTCDRFLHVYKLKVPVFHQDCHPENEAVNSLLFLS